MPSFDQLVSIGPPSTAEYSASLDDLEGTFNRIDDGDPVANIDKPGEFAFANPQGLIGWFDTNDSYFIPHRRFMLANRAILVVPDGPGGLPVGADLTGGTVTLAYEVASSRPVDVFKLDLTAGAFASGIYTYQLANYAWLRGAAIKFGSALRQTLIVYHVRFAFQVRTTRHWARLVDGGSFDSVGGDTPSVLQSRRYRMRYADVSTFAELTDGDGKWNVVGIEPEGRRRYMELDVQRSVRDAHRNVS